MIVKENDKKYEATHIFYTPYLPIPIITKKTFSSFLAAKCWLIVMDDRNNSNSWTFSCIVA